MGQGDGDTKWKGWPWKLLLRKLDITYQQIKLNSKKPIFYGKGNNREKDKYTK